MVTVKAWFLVALGLASGGSTCRGQSTSGDNQKEGPAAVDVNLAEIDITSLTPREKKEWSSYVSSLLAPCADTPVPISQCVKEKRGCPKCLPAAKMILKGVRDGANREMVEQSFHNRFDADRIKDVRVGESPSRGPSSAPVVVVEFADFECPHCQLTAPLIDKLVDSHKDTVRFVYKFMPLPSHSHAVPAARAALAAGAQGKFWEMHHKLFVSFEHLDQTDLEGYARELALDVVKFRVDMESQQTTDRLAADRTLADDLKVAGTPTIYVNGRLYERVQSLEEWVDLDLQLLGVKDGVPSPSSRAVPDAGKGLLPEAGRN